MVSKCATEQEREIARLKRINAALIERVEASSLPRCAPYAAFEHAALLSEQVRERTQTLNQTLQELRVSNRLLAEARQRAEEANQTLVDAIESLTDAFVLFDADGRVARFNHHFAEFWAPAGIQVQHGMKMGELYQLARDTGLVVDVKAEQDEPPSLYHLHDGRWVQVHTRPTRYGGQVVLYIDITALKRQENAQRERALAEKSRLLQATLDSLSQGVAVIDAGSRLEMCNQRFLTLTGLEEPVLPCPLDSLSALLPLIDDGDVKGITEACERRLPDGRIVEVRGHAMPTHGQVLTFTDVTERIRYTQTLLERERWIRTITDELPAMIAYLDRDLRYVFVNRVYERWYGWPHGMLPGRGMKELHSPAHCQRLIPHLKRVLAGETASFELTERNADGEERVLLRSYVPHRESHACLGDKALADHGAAGQDSDAASALGVIGVFVLIRDITEQRRTTEALHHAYQNLEQRVRERTAELTQVNKQLRDEIMERSLIEQRLREAKTEAENANLSKTKFLAAVSHDLLQPLNAAQLFAGALEEHPMPAEGQELVTAIGRSLKDVESLLGTLVDISRLDAGVITPEISAFTMEDLLGNLAREYQQVAASKGLQLHYIPCHAVVKSDSALLGRVVRNLLSNAVRYTRQGRLLLGCRRRHEGLEIQVADTGVGIEAHEIDIIFQEFRRLNTARHGDRGLGLGLSIVDRIGRILDHPLRVKSTPGHGSLFSILLPYANRTPKNGISVQPGLPILGADQLAGKRIWVVDNDIDICQGMKTLLTRWQCLVVVASDQESLSRQVKLTHEQVDVLIVDYHLDNDNTGIALAQQINAQRRHPVPVMAITANHSTELRHRIRELGYQLLLKPVKPLKLRMALTQLISSHASLMPERHGDRVTGCPEASGDAPPIIAGLRTNGADND